MKFDVKKITDLTIDFSKSAVNKISKFAKSNPWLSAVIAVLAVGIIVLVSVLAFGGDKEAADFKWGNGVTEGIPLFSEQYVSVNGSETFGAVYYNDVTSEQIAEYASKLEQDCGIKFNGDKYPRSAVMNDKIIVLHYNVTEKKFSVTVSLKGDNTLQEKTHDDQELNQSDNN